ncbi:MAG: DNA polymerase III subunit delta' [Phycisphaerae bacterium]|nr:DNA polymerase III subunit delta' [Phycisphaerae bacterium]NUQ46331.1 DNA polymerase III subunit delta' [Phycisphaerae bacterium]
MKWTDVQHQEDALSRIDRALRSGRMPHAYLFAGPDGVGKGMTAIRLARRLLCPNAADDACGKCDDCVAVEAGTHLDLHLIYRALNKLHPDKRIRDQQARDFSVDVIRMFVVDAIGHAPVRGRAKVFIIEKAERLRAGGGNSLLKTLEEPPPRSYLILLTQTPEQILPTIRSRCQTIEFHRLPDEFVHSRLRKEASLPEADAAYIVGLAEGRLGMAMKLAGGGLSANRQQVLELIERASDDPLAASREFQDLGKALLKQGAVSVEDEGSEGAANRAAQQLVLSMIGCALRDVLRTAVGQPPIAHPTDAAALQRIARRMGPQAISGAIRALATAETHIAQNVSEKLLFDGLAMAIEHGHAQIA